MDRHLPDDQLDRLMACFLAERRAEIVAAALPYGAVGRAGREHRPRTGRPLTAGARSWPGRPLTSALLVGLALLALTAGSALVGSQPTGPAPDPLSKLVRDPVGPGVWKVVDDGSGHELTSAGMGDLGRRDIATGADGSVWLADRNTAQGRALFRLGVAGASDAVPLQPYFQDLTVATDGTVWAVGAGGSSWPKGSLEDQLYSLRDGVWSSHSVPDGFTVAGIEAQPTASVLVNGLGHQSMRGCGRAPVVGRMTDGGWEALPAFPEQVTSTGDGGSLAVLPDGTAWLGIDRYNTCADWAGLLRSDGDTWSVEPAVLGGKVTEAMSFAIGPIAARDGTLWVYGARDRGMLVDKERWLWRYDDGTWTSFDEAHDIPILVMYSTYVADMAVGTDGRLWVAFDEPRLPLRINQGAGGFLDRPDGGCVGLLSFDGVTWRTHLPGRCANDVAVASDGSVWVSVTDDQWFDDDSWSGRKAWQTAIAGAGVYVIDPEAAFADP